MHLVSELKPSVCEKYWEVFQHCCWVLPAGSGRLWLWWTLFLGRRSCALRQQAATGSETSPGEGCVWWCAHVACIYASTEEWSASWDEEWNTFYFLFFKVDINLESSFRSETDISSITAACSFLFFYKKNFKIKKCNFVNLSFPFFCANIQKKK